MASFIEVLAVLGLVALIVGLFGKRYLKEKRFRTRVAGAGAILTFIGAALGGFAFAGVPAFLAAGPAAPPGPSAGALWDVAIDEADSDSDTDRTETELESPDQHSLLWIMNDANMDGLGDMNVEVDVYNLNSGLTTEIWIGEVSIAKVGTVIVSGIPTPVANYTTDRSRFAVTYSEGTTFTAGEVLQVHDKARFTSTSLGAESIVIAMPIDPAVTDDVPAGGSFVLQYNVGGILITLTAQES